jgi:hypothetical protein
MPNPPYYFSAEYLSKYNPLFKEPGDGQNQSFDTKFMLNMLTTSLVGGIFLFLLYRNRDRITNASVKILDEVTSCVQSRFTYFKPAQQTNVVKPAVSTSIPADFTPKLADTTNDDGPLGSIQELEDLIGAETAADKPEPNEFEADDVNDFSAAPKANSKEVVNTQQMRRR